MGFGEDGVEVAVFKVRRTGDEDGVQRRIRMWRASSGGRRARMSRLGNM